MGASFKAGYLTPTCNSARLSAEGLRTGRKLLSLNAPESVNPLPYRIDFARLVGSGPDLHICQASLI